MGQANSSTSLIDIDAMRKGAQINRDQSSCLINPVTRVEIEQALNGIGDQKSPGMDGYFSLGLMEDRMAKRCEKGSKKPRRNIWAEADTFSLGLMEDRMAKRCEKGSKKPRRNIWAEADTIMTQRLGKILPTIVGANQAAFIPGQVIHNHILMAFELMRGYTWKGGTPRCMLQLDLQKAYDMVEW
ncbi:uncharacterized protein LOC131640989 [Vicia villosa]|uniref:uncharacterized protein LOC131640989 n=1 Tax=Vicia villosa TaxID=3911 RepID=UPI00273A7EDD|nr:uncharacterized protein LOC131640989 [Vicia villosa]